MIPALAAAEIIALALLSVVALIASRRLEDRRAPEWMQVALLTVVLVAAAGAALWYLDGPQGN